MFSLPLNSLILKWLDIARWAPSADNLQPWTIDWEIQTDFKIKFSLEINDKFHCPRNLDIALNSLALGCFCQNLISIARNDGYSLDTILPIDSGFSIVLAKSTFVDETPWASLICQRQTRRGIFQKKPLGQSDLEAIKKIVQKYKDLNLSLFTSDFSDIATLISRLDVIRYQNEYHYQHFMRALHFTKDGNDAGIAANSLEIPWVGEVTLKALAIFPFLRFIFWIGTERIFTYLGCKQLLENSSGLIYISARNYNNWSWFDLGRCLQEIWLEITQRGLSAQPFGHSLISFDCHLTPNAYSTQHQSLVNDVYQKFLKLQTDIYQPGIFLRLGYPSKTLSRRSKRYPVSQLLLSKRQNTF